MNALGLCRLFCLQQRFLYLWYIFIFNKYSSFFDGSASLLSKIDLFHRHLLSGGEVAGYWGNAHGVSLLQDVAIQFFTLTVPARRYKKRQRQALQ